MLILGRQALGVMKARKRLWGTLCSWCWICKWLDVVSWIFIQVKGDVGRVLGQILGKDGVGSIPKEYGSVRVPDTVPTGNQSEWWEQKQKFSLGSTVTGPQKFGPKGSGLFIDHTCYEGWGFWNHYLTEIIVYKPSLGWFHMVVCAQSLQVPERN